MVVRYASRINGLTGLAVTKLDGLTGENDDQNIGIQIIRRAVEEPIRQIVQNAGHEGSIVVAKLKESKGDDGFNAATDTYEDLVKAGVIDPAKVVRNALQNAASIASLLLTTEAIITDIPEEKPAGGGAPAMPHGDMY